MKNLNEIEQNLTDLNERLNRIEEKIDKIAPEPKARIALRREGELYYYIDGDSDIVDTYEVLDMSDDARFEIGNYFKSVEDAESALEKMQVYTQLKDIATRLNAGRKIDWHNPNQLKYKILKTERGLLLDDATLCQSIGNIYCLSDNFLTAALEEMGEEELRTLFDD